MPESHIWFEWERPSSQFCWWEDLEPRGSRVIGYERSGVRQDLIPGDRYLVVDEEPEHTPSKPAHAPLDPSGIFRDFAALPLHCDAILAFANRYGMLTDGNLLCSDDPGEDTLDGDIPGEPATVWVEEISRMKFLNDFWQLVRTSDRRGLEKYIKWTRGGADAIDPPRGGAFQFDDGQGIWVSRTVLAGSWLAKAPHQRDVLSAARYLLDSLVSEQLRAQIDAVLVHDGLGRPAVRFAPRDLRSALWLQFARAIEGNKEFQQCDHCHRWYEIGSREGGRTDKRFCSTACRARNWRQSKAAQQSPEKRPSKKQKRG
jgi:hypothetical protein